MNVQQFLESFRQLPQSTQIALIVLVLILVVGIRACPKSLLRRYEAIAPSL